VGQIYEEKGKNQSGKEKEQFFHKRGEISPTEKPQFELQESIRKTGGKVIVPRSTTPYLLRGKKSLLIRKKNSRGKTPRAQRLSQIEKAQVEDPGEKLIERGEKYNLTTLLAREKRLKVSGRRGTESPSEKKGGVFGTA